MTHPEAITQATELAGKMRQFAATEFPSVRAQAKAKDSLGTELFDFCSNPDVSNFPDAEYLVIKSILKPVAKETGFDFSVNL